MGDEEVPQQVRPSLIDWFITGGIALCGAGMLFRSICDVAYYIKLEKKSAGL